MFALKRLFPLQRNVFHHHSFMADYKYYQDEIREGFYIPGMVKRSWAAQMQVLKVIARICRENDIKWFADCGTLIGTVRHAGFIPWDDDLDICMLRDDFERFNRLIKTQLPKEYVVLNEERFADYDNFLTRIVNSDGIDMGKEYLESHEGFPYTAGVDIYPLDYLFEDEQREKERRERTLELWNFFHEMAENKIQLSDNELNEKILSISGIAPDRKLCPGDRIRKTFIQLAKACEERTSRVVLMPMYIPLNNHIYPTEYFEKTIKMPFEHTLINVPAAYDEVLKIEYGNWYVATQKGGIHDYPFFKHQQAILLEEKKAAPYVFWCDKNIIRDYCFGDKNIEIKSARESHRLQCDLVLQLLDSLKTAHGQLRADFKQGGIPDKDMQLLTDCQDAAITIGTAIENENGQNHPTVALLEEYCEKVYRLFEKAGNVFNGDAGSAENADFSVEMSGLEELLDLIIESYLKDGKKKKYVFLPSTIAEWKGMLPRYEQLRQDAGSDTSVIIVPTAFRDHAGNPVGEAKVDEDLFAMLGKTPGLEVTDYRQFDFGHEHPYSFVIADPFDEYESARTVHPFFYSENLSKYCDRLIFCHSYELDEIQSDEPKALENVKRIIKSPGVLFSDIIYVPNENMKKTYLEVLKETDGEVHADYWDEKIKVYEAPCEDARDGMNSEGQSSRKTVLFYVGISDIFVYKEKAFNWIRNTLSVFDESKEKTENIWLMEDEWKDNFSEVFPEGRQMLDEIIETFEKSGGKVTSYEESLAAIREADAFYGSPGYFMNLCVRRKIPVMVRREPEG